MSLAVVLGLGLAALLCYALSFASGSSLSCGGGLCYASVRRLSGSEAFGWVALVLYAPLLSLSPWASVPYSDTLATGLVGVQVYAASSLHGRGAARWVALGSRVTVSAPQTCCRNSSDCRNPARRRSSLSSSGPSSRSDHSRGRGHRGIPAPARGQTRYLCALGPVLCPCAALGALRASDMIRRAPAAATTWPPRPHGLDSTSRQAESKWRCRPCRRSSA